MISFSDLCFFYQSEHILKKLSGKIEPNEFIAIIGPNGGGKTTFLKLLMGLLRPKHGTLSLSTDKISYVPQRLDFDRQFPVTVRDVVLMGLLSTLTWTGRYPKSTHNRCDALLKELQIDSFANRPFGALSGGQMQRVLIARALLSDPDLLLLDEPTANIDRETSEAILQLLLTYKGKKTILMVTHHLDTIIDHVDRVFCIQGELSILEPKEVCKHFAYGTYHAPLLGDKECSHE